MVNEPFLKHLRPALPVDVAAPAREEASHGVPAEVVDPAFVAELAHQSVYPGEPRLPELPAPEPFLRFGGIDHVLTRDEVGGWVDLRGEMPGDEADVGIVVCLGEGVAERGLSGEVHVSEEELADEVRGHRGGLFGVGGFSDDGEDAVVEEADGEGAEVVVRREQGCGLGGEGGGCGGGFGECGSVVFVGDDGVESGEGDGFAAAVLGGGWFEAKLGHGGDGKVVVGAGEGAVGCIFAGALDAVDVRVWGRLGLFKVKY